MKKLDKYNVQELNKMEMEKTDGGWVAVAIAVYLALALYTHEHHH